jgi:hypothetical protein
MHDDEVAVDDASFGGTGACGTGDVDVAGSVATSTTGSSRPAHRPFTDAHPAVNPHPLGTSQWSTAPVACGRGTVAEPREEHLDFDDRWRAIVDHERDSAVRELTRYLLSRPWIDPKTLMGGVVHHDPHHLARLRELVEVDLATTARCLETLDVLAAPKD